MKIIICLHEFHTTGAFPNQRALKYQIGHNLLLLRDQVIERCYTPAYLNYGFAQIDHQFLLTNPVLVQMLDALNDFANGDRYLFMNSISEPTIGREWPKMRWEEVQKVALTEEINNRLLIEDYTELIRRANHETQSHIERFTRALARLFIYGNLGEDAQHQYTLISEFLRLQDNELGIKNYNF